jgi:multiple sugar transport system substrate-binding protein
MYKDHLYGVTVGLNVWALYYRPDYFREAGLDPDHLPGTLQELEAWGHKMDRFDDKGQLVRMGFLPEGYRVFAPVFGGGFYDWAQGSLQIDTPQNLKALQWMASSRAQLGFDKVTRFESSLQAAVGTDWPLISGAYGMLVDGQWRVEEAKRFAPNFEYRTAPIPPALGGFKNASFSNGNFMIIPSTAHDPEGAWEFIKFWSGLSQPERAAEFYTWGGWLPINKEVARAPIYQSYVKDHPQFKTFVDLLDSPNIEPIPPVPYQVFFYDRLLNAEQSVESGSKSGREAMDILVHEVNQELAHRKEFGYVDGQ